MKTYKGNNMRKRGFRHAFTMIELIFVIIILGILAATALPKFVGIQDDAKIAAEKGTVGGVRGGIAMSHGKWLLNQSSSLDWDGQGAATFSSDGYLANLDTGGATTTTAASDNIFAEILTEESTDWIRVATTGTESNGTYEGPASHASNGVTNEDTNDINKSGEWRYFSDAHDGGSAGSFVYSSN